MESINTIIKPKEKQTLIKEGDQYWNPNTGEIFNLDGELIAHDLVYRRYRNPKIDFDDYNIKEE